MLQSIKQSKSKTFFAFCFCFLLGVGAASAFNLRPSPFLLSIIFLIPAVFLSMFWRSPKYRFVTLGIMIILLGISRYVFAFPASLELSLRTDDRAAFNAVVAQEPDVRMGDVRYIVRKREGGERIFVKTGLYPRYDYGDIVRVECMLQRPEPVEEFRYDMYLAVMGVFILCDNPMIQKVGNGEGNVFMGAVLSLKKKTAEKINRLWHEPYAGFMAGLLYGYRGGLGELNDAFVRTGVSHVVAISGYNIAIIGKILHTFFVRGLWINRKRAYWIIMVCILFFVVFVGMSPSVVRAGIMGMLVLSAQQFGRAARSANMLILAATLMVFWNPFILLWDAGFQLSFLATIGIIYLPPLWENRLAKIPTFLGFREIVGSTFAAILITLPILLYQFGRVSLVAPLVNILILPLIPWIMGAGALALAFGFFFPLEKVFSWLALLGMRYVVGVVEWFAELPFASFDVRISWWVMLVMYAMMLYWMYNRTRISRITQMRHDPG